MKILIVDNKLITRIPLVDELVEKGYDVFEYDSANTAIKQMEELKPDLIITNINLASITGHDFLLKIKKIYKNTYVVFMSEYPSNMQLVECIRLGAYDYFEIPFNSQKVQNIISRVKKLIKLKDTNRQLKLSLKQNYNFSSCIGKSPELIKIKKTLKVAALKTKPVLLTGEPGTGKNFMANIIHYNSKYSLKSIVRINCTELNNILSNSKCKENIDNYFEKEITSKTGSIKIHFGGTIYFNNIDKLHISLQTMLLRYIKKKEYKNILNKTRKINFRIIASSEKDLQKLVDTGRFKNSLYQYLNVYSIKIPPLRERPEDIVPLIKHFASKYPQLPVKNIGCYVNPTILKYSFHGNISELKNIVERISILHVFNENLE